MAFFLSLFLAYSKYAIEFLETTSTLNQVLRSGHRCAPAYAVRSFVIRYNIKRHYFSPTAQPILDKAIE